MNEPHLTIVSVLIVGIGLLIYFIIKFKEAKE